MKSAVNWSRCLLLITAIFILAACNKPGKEQKVIAIATLMTHPSLDAVLENTKKELALQGFVEGKNVSYIIKNANGQISATAGIASELASRNPDLIIAITTPMAQAVAKKANCPVVFAAVTDPVGAGILASLKGEKNITGTSDAWPYEDQMKLIKEITPGAKRLGVIYDPGSPGSESSMKQIRSLAPSLGFQLLERAVNSTNDVYPAAQDLSGSVDAFYLASDNTVISGMTAALKVASKQKIPLYVGDGGTVEKGGLAAVSVGYPVLGTETGKLAARALKGEQNIPVYISRGTEIYLNAKSAELMGVKVPDEITKKATKIYTEIK